MHSSNLSKKAIKSWIRGGRELGFRVTAPYVLRVNDKSVTCVGFVPDFGGPNGMVIGGMAPPQFQTDSQLVECAKTANMYWSFVNLQDYDQYQPDVLKEALADWGFWGPKELRPPWLP
jgi:hypothetical protein